MKPKGLRLFDRDGKSPTDFEMTDSPKVFELPPHGCVLVAGETFLDADQLDKLAQRCKQWAMYLRSQKGQKPTVKKWEDL